ncbi:MAG: hypothetical protein JSS81_09025 [Acidobacteria bacterium]|nr:hypothetical protein [Acidobacteriota bacterium]
MSFIASSKSTLIFFLLLVVIAVLPVWSVDYFINQDGSGHLYGSYLILEIFRKTPETLRFFALNSISIPNSSGHWLLAFLLLFFNPFLTTKIIVTLTFAGFVAAAGWLRQKTAPGAEGLKTSLLFGAVLGFNWLWFLGFYNFIIGVVCLAATVGLFFHWREELNPKRLLLIAGLLLIAYLSHIVSFMILSGTLFLLAVTVSREKIFKNLLGLAAAVVPVVPLAILYKSLSAGGGGFYPAWRNLDNPFSPLSWFAQIRTADPFILISRTAFPFLSDASALYALFTPAVWIYAFVLLMLYATFYRKERSKLNANSLLFLTLLLLSIAGAMFAPDDFGLTNGSIIRERILLCGLFFLIPLFRTEDHPKLKRIGQLCLVVVFIFQTAALWDYALRTDREAHLYMEAARALPEGERIASVVVLEDGRRFHSLPMTQMSSYLGIGRNVVVLDNYEAGHYLFPVVARQAEDKQFIFDLTTSNVYTLNNPDEKFDEKLARLDAVLSRNQGRITTLVLWGRNPKVESTVGRWFAPTPYFENGSVRLFHAR